LRSSPRTTPKEPVSFWVSGCVSSVSRTSIRTLSGCEETSARPWAIGGTIIAVDVWNWCCREEENGGEDVSREEIALSTQNPAIIEGSDVRLKKVCAMTTREGWYMLTSSLGPRSECRIASTAMPSRTASCSIFQQPSWQCRV
jgi:hypothetical protein